MSEAKLGKFLAEVSNWRWDEFIKAENDNQYTSNQAIIFGLIRACAMQKLDAIKLSLNRLDGKLKTPIKVEYPKIFYQFPNATLDSHTKSTEATTDNKLMLIPAPDDVITGELITYVEADEEDLPSLSLRQTLAKMSDLPRELPEKLVEAALATDQWMQGHAPQPYEIPMVKSVVAAHLLILAANRNINALTEVFDQIDGKLAETIQIIGDDIYIVSYASEAPEGSYLNDKGVVEVEAKVAQDLWAHKLGKQMEEMT